MLRRCYGNKGPEFQKKGVRFALMDFMQTGNVLNPDDFTDSLPKYESANERRSKARSALDLKANSPLEDTTIEDDNN